ncbi:DUF4871 domain-containing protein [Paenibacillus sp. L3-i20]|uniref:DUF4871 domain-containing protein n=1 Tax=Paenibacillus sp. L3-i20 TaxID=2905833 RepID=UPI001EDD8245|nr:DUF4871 domain-containing protein [Paenibacillus sp. L3-i20]GKU76119.1 hypothetical protein L3i20_v205160 [Paenibacillus sp. L3-i20]
MKKMIALIVTLLFIVGCENAQKNDVVEWTISPLFESGSYSMIGEEGKVGFIYDDSEVLRFYPEKIQKYMWHFWGDSKELEGSLKITATSKDSGEVIIVHEGAVSNPLNGADGHTPSNLSLPTSGLWRFDIQIAGKHFGSIVVKAHEATN